MKGDVERSVECEAGTLLVCGETDNSLGLKTLVFNGRVIHENVKAESVSMEQVDGNLLLQVVDVDDKQSFYHNGELMYEGPGRVTNFGLEASSGKIYVLIYAKRPPRRRYRLFVGAESVVEAPFIECVDSDEDLFWHEVLFCGGESLLKRYNGGNPVESHVIFRGYVELLGVSVGRHVWCEKGSFGEIFAVYHGENRIKRFDSRSSYPRGVEFVGYDGGRLNFVFRYKRDRKEECSIDVGV